MPRLYNRAGVATATAGTGTITLGAALAASTPINSCGFNDFATAGASDGETVSYLILDANGAWEYGTGVYTAAGTTLSRTLGQSSTGSLLVLSGSAQVFITARKQDVANLGEANTFTAANTFSAAQTFINSSGIKIQDTDASHTTGLIGGSNLTADRTLTITTGDANRAVTLSGDTTLSGTNTGNDPVIIQSQSVSGVTEIDFTTGLDDTYDNYMLDLINLTVSNDGVGVGLRIATSGPTWKSGASDYEWGMQEVGNAAVAHRGDTADDAIDLAGHTSLVGNASGEHFSGTVRFDNPEATKWPLFDWSARWNDTTAAIRSACGVGRYIIAATAIVGVRIFPSAGTVSGLVVLRGWKKS